MGKKRDYSISMVKKNNILFKDLCEMYFKKCEANGITHYTINGYKNTLKYFGEFLNLSNKGLENFYCEEINDSLFDDFKLYLKNIRKVKDITINSYIRKLTPMLSYGMELGYIVKFPYTYVKQQETFKIIYTEEELKILLTKPSEGNTTNRFAEFRNWCIINFLLSTGVRSLELRELKIKNIDLPNDLINLSHTKNKKPRQIPICKTLHNVLVEYLQYRGGEMDDYLFPNSFGDQLPRTTLQMAITKYSKKRGIFKYSLHLYRHTYATLFLKNGGQMSVLKSILGHSSYRMVEIYLHMAGKDLKQANEFNPLDKIKTENKMIKR